METLTNRDCSNSSVIIILLANNHSIMKANIYFLVSLFICGVHISGCDKGNDDNTEPDANNVITKDDFIAKLGKYTSYHVDVYNKEIEPGPSGTDVTWDFSDYDEVAITTTVEDVECPGEAICSEFPEANRVYAAQGPAAGIEYSFHQLTDDELNVIGGMGADGLKTHYDDPQTTYKFPMSYGSKFSDSYSYTAGSEVLAGKQTVEVDGFGTLKTVADTFPNTLRIKRAYEINVTHPSGGHTSTVVTYTWINKAHKGLFLLQLLFSETTLHGHTQPSGFGKSLIYTIPE